MNTGKSQSERILSMLYKQAAGGSLTRRPQSNATRCLPWDWVKTANC